MGEAEATSLVRRDVELPEENRAKVAARHVTLPNGLQACLLHDPRAEESGAAAAVHTGFFNDPADLPGLAHFCEHMLFMGTDKYPNESEYRKFITEHGGSSNAYTNMEETNYHFSVASDSLEATLDRFAQFFISPLFMESVTNRELNAIHSEHEKNIQSDIWRQWQLLKDISSKEHPFHKFGTGNLETLSTSAEDQKIDIRARLLEFAKKWYSANTTKVCVYGKASLDELESLVVEKFSLVPNKEVEPMKTQGLPFAEEQFGKLIKMIPVRDQRKVVLYWSLDCGHDEYLSKPDRYSSFFIGHESGGSILHYLRKREWAEELCAGTGICGSNWGIYYIDIELTTSGMEHVNEVVQVVFQYIEMLKAAGVKKEYWEEERETYARHFRFMEVSDPLSIATSVARSMLHVQPQHSLSSDYRFGDLQEERAMELIEALSPAKCLVMMVSKEFSLEDCPLTADWYGTNYSEGRVDEATMAMWKSPGENSSLHLPTPNPYLPTDFTLRYPEAAKAGPTHRIPPKRLIVEPNREIYFAPDSRFSQPKGHVLYHLSTPLAYCTLHFRAMCRVLERTIKDHLNDTSYHADNAGVAFSLTPLTTGISVMVSGFSQKLPLVAERVFRALLEVSPTKENFEMWVDNTRQTMSGHRADSPYHQAIERGSMMSMTCRWLPSELLPSLDGLTLEEFHIYRKHLFERVSVEGLIMGNFTEEEAIELDKRLEATYFSTITPPLPAEAPRERALKYPKGVDWLCFYPNGNVEDTNTGIEMAVQVGGRSTKLIVTCDVLARLMEAPFFSALRTVESLGYVVISGVLARGTAEGFRFLIQSEKYPPLYLYSRILAFLQSFQTHLKELKQEEFDRCVEAEVKLREDMPKSLSSEAGKFWGEISPSREFNFTREKEQIEALKALNLGDLTALWDKCFGLESPSRRWLTVAVVGSTYREEAEGFQRDNRLITHTTASWQPPSLSASKVEDAKEGEGEDGEEEEKGEEEAPLLTLPDTVAARSISRISNPSMWKNLCGAYPNCLPSREFLSVESEVAPPPKTGGEGGEAPP